jgi:carbon-monoxide dehydrogenase medium subunit
VIAAAFEYSRATSLDDAVAKLGAANGEGKVIAGGHSLVPLMKLRLAEPRVLIDIGRIPGLSGVFTRDDGIIQIGAATVHHDVATSPLLQDLCPMMSETAADIGDQQVRNRGTLGGSLAHADPAADYPAVMLALDAEIHAKGPAGWRVVRAPDFFQGLFTVDLAPDEIIAAVRFQPIKAAAYAKLHQRASRFAIVGVAAALDASGGTIRSARVGVTGATACAVRLPGVETRLAGAPLTDESLERAAKGAGESLTDLNSDIHASDEYRRAMVEVFTLRALRRAAGRAGTKNEK